MGEDQTSSDQATVGWRGIVSALWITFVFAYFVLRALAHLQLADLPWIAK